MNLLLSISSLLAFFLGALISYLLCQKMIKKITEGAGQEKEVLNSKINEQLIKISTLTKEIDLSQNNISFYKEQILELEKRMALQFENLSNKIMKESMGAFEKNSTKSLSQVLGPLQEKIGTFQTKVEYLYGEEAKERHSLKNEIKAISEIGHQLNQDALNLTKALKGDVKAQGNWGEVVLEKILENSGLREGEEYLSQARGMGLKDDSGSAQRPDVVVMLPDNKNVIIDSKVSLTHYEQYIAEENQSQKAAFLKLFNDSITAHVKGLSDKGYHQNDKLRSPDFVLLFFPIEGAYSLAIQHNPDLFYWAWDRSIIIVGPTTLMATLKTIHSIWRQEKSNKNAMAIATESGKLYDKMANFLLDLEKIGEQIKRTEETYINSYKKLKGGPGNVIGKLEKIKELGAKAKKQIEVETDLS